MKIPEQLREFWTRRPQWGWPLLFLTGGATAFCLPAGPVGLYVLSAYLVGYGLLALSFYRQAQQQQQHLLDDKVLKNSMWERLDSERHYSAAVKRECSLLHAERDILRIELSQLKNKIQHVTRATQELERVAAGRESPEPAA